MKISLNWLNDYIDLSDHSPDDIALKLTMSTCEVEDVETVFGHLDSVVVGKVTQKEKHPDADKLSVCTVDLGGATSQIVCGAPNVAAGQTVAVAVPGTILPGDFKIKESKIRGVASAGMICSEAELGLAEEAEGIWVLPADYQAGHKLGEYLQLKDVILDIDNKSVTHRPDLWGHYGFARELSAILKRELKPLPGSGFNLAQVRDKNLKPVTVNIEENAAINYCGMTIDQIKVGPSPDWLQARLTAVGQKPINNIVDISNYVMLELGQPNHAFDRTTLGEDIYICRSDKPRKFTTLDEIEREIPAGSIFIATDKNGQKTDVALGGIMGGLNSEIGPQTQTVFLESACFYRTDIRKTLSKIGLRTDAAMRFEKGVSPVQSQWAMARFVELLAETCPGLKVSDLNKSEEEAFIRTQVKLRPDLVRARLGAQLEDQLFMDILSRLDYTVDTKDPAVWHVGVPEYRSKYDISLEIDLIEEIGRIYGYDNIKETAPLVACEVPAEPNPTVRLTRQVRDLCVERYGLCEIFQYSFTSAQSAQSLRPELDQVELHNAVAPDATVMRPSLLPGVLKAVLFNAERFDDLGLFELGRVYYRDKGETEVSPFYFGSGEDHKEEFWLTLALCPPRSKDHKQANFQTFLHLKNIALDLAAHIGLAEHKKSKSPAVFALNDSEKEYLHPGLALDLVGADSVLGSLGLLHPKTAKEYDLKRDVLIFELNLSAAWTAAETARAGKKDAVYRPPSVYPPVDFDFTVVTEDGRSTGGIYEIIRRLKISEIDSVEFVSSYKGDPLPAHQEALSYRIKLVPQKQTLTGEEMQTIRTKVVNELEKAGFPLRA